LELPLQDDDLMPQHGVLDDEFSATPNHVDRRSAREAGPGVGATLSR
jgi:hypothetical protein